MKQDVWIVASKRTPIGKKDGMLKDWSPQQLAATVIRTLPYRNEVEEVILGNVVGPGGNVARYAALESDLPFSVTGVTIDRQCGSGLEAIRYGYALIQSGLHQCVYAGGTESTSQSTYEKRAPFSPMRYGDPDMGEAAEYVAEKFGVSRSQQDAFALRSYERAQRAHERGWFEREMIQLPDIPLRDEALPNVTSFSRFLERCRPVFKKAGTVTIGNSCVMNDGACVTVMMSTKKTLEYGIKKALRVVEFEVSGRSPMEPGAGPMEGVPKLLTRHGLAMRDIDFIEFNEAFAAQVVACFQSWQDVDMEKVNVHGGGIATGHPYGASGALLINRLFYLLQERNQNSYALATLGIGGGIGLTVLCQWSDVT